MAGKQNGGRMCVISLFTMLPDKARQYVSFLCFFNFTVHFLSIFLSETALLKWQMQDVCHISPHKGWQSAAICVKLFLSQKSHDGWYPPRHFSSVIQNNWQSWHASYKLVPLLPFVRQCSEKKLEFTLLGYSWWYLYTWNRWRCHTCVRHRRRVDGADNCSIRDQYSPTNVISPQGNHD